MEEHSSFTRATNKLVSPGFTPELHFSFLLLPLSSLLIDLGYKDVSPLLLA